METIDAPVVTPTKTPVVEPVKNEEPKLPPMYSVILHNDPSTHYFAVVDVLCQIFNIDGQRAQDIMWTAHRNGKAIVKIVSKDMAETQVERAMTYIGSLKGANGMDRNAACQLTFTAEPESDGDK